jgi:hypothetical protein
MEVTTMRRTVGTVLLGLGVFLVVAAGLIRFYAYPSLARVPGNYDEVTRLEASGAQVFNTDPDVLKPETTDLSIAARTVADANVKDAPDDVVVWQTATTITRADGTIFQQSRDRAPFDAVTGAAADCSGCGSWVEESEGRQTDVTRTGQVLKFPFDTQKHDYAVWDDTTGKAYVAKYMGEASIQGLTTYRFVQEVPGQVVSQEEVPGSVFGSKKPSVQADMWYSMTRTFYIEPATGSPVDRVEQRTQELRYAGTSVPAFIGTVRYTDAQISDQVSSLKTKALLLSGSRTWLPLVLLLVGLVLAGLGYVMSRDEDVARDGAVDGHDAKDPHRPLIGS